MTDTWIPKTDPAVVAQMSEMGINLLAPQKGIAARIPDNNVLREFIRAISCENRLKVYESLVPHLSFKAKPYWWLMSGKKRKQSARGIYNASKKR